jgi:hypothetical protein
MLPYMLRITPHGLLAMIFRERWPQRERQCSGAGLEEKISREAMNSTLRKLSMIIHIAKAFVALILVPYV